eukprot:Polyplicarium_translucidae@DN2233_c0_g1_i2.p1
MQELLGTAVPVIDEMKKFARLALMRSTPINDAAITWRPEYIDRPPSGTISEKIGALLQNLGRTGDITGVQVCVVEGSPRWDGRAGIWTFRSVANLSSGVLGAVNPRQMTPTSVFPLLDLSSLLTVAALHLQMRDSFQSTCDTPIHEIWPDFIADSPRKEDATRVWEKERHRVRAAAAAAIRVRSDCWKRRTTLRHALCHADGLHYTVNPLTHYEAVSRLEAVDSTAASVFGNATPQSGPSTWPWAGRNEAAVASGADMIDSRRPSSSRQRVGFARRHEVLKFCVDSVPAGSSCRSRSSVWSAGVLRARILKAMLAGRQEIQQYIAQKLSAPLGLEGELVYGMPPPKLGGHCRPVAEIHNALAEQLAVTPHGIVSLENGTKLGRIPSTWQDVLRMGSEAQRELRALTTLNENSPMAGGASVSTRASASPQTTDFSHAVLFRKKNFAGIEQNLKVLTELVFDPCSVNHSHVRRALPAALSGFGTAKAIATLLAGLFFDLPQSADDNDPHESTTALGISRTQKLQTLAIHGQECSPVLGNRRWGLGVELFNEAVPLQLRMGHADGGQLLTPPSEDGSGPPHHRVQMNVAKACGLQGYGGNFAMCVPHLQLSFAVLTNCASLDRSPRDAIIRCICEELNIEVPECAQG